MSVQRIGLALLEGRRAAGLTQRQVSQRMGTTASAVSRVETGGAAPSTGFVDRYAGAIGRQVLVPFGPAPLTPEERLDYIRRVYQGWLLWRGGRYYPEPADLILRQWIDLDPAELYCRMLGRAERRLEEGIPMNMDPWDDLDMRGPVAVAVMYHDVIDWRLVRRKRFRSQQSLDERIRRRARTVVTGLPWEPGIPRELPVPGFPELGVSRSANFS